MLIGKKIRKSFNSSEVLCGVNIEIHAGRISVLIGPSGGGKTTLIRALSFLDYPSHGEIIFNEQSYHFPLQNNNSIRPPWPDLTVVFQQHFLWPHLTLRNNILLPLKGRPKSRHTVDELIRIFEMSEFIDRYPNEASIGQRQRAALARAFALEPKCILLDEITSALDVEQTDAVIRHLLTLRNQGIGMLVVTHLLAFAEGLVSRNEGDRVYFMDRGEIIASGGREFFEKQTNPRVAKFISSMDYWGQASGNISQRLGVNDR
jgi:ABC-type polar amino acid transport system ATPase subunit